MRALSRAQAALGRLGLVLVGLRPTGPMLAAAGAGRLRPLHVAVADLVGTVLHLLVLAVVGRAVVPSAPVVAHLGWLAPAVAALAVGSLVVKAARRRRERRTNGT